MKPKNKRKGIDRTAPRCPYCGSHTILRSADGIYRENARNDMLYVCKNYPVCDSYVRVQRGTKIPLGTVANRELRELRAEAHRQFDKLYKHGYMSKHDAYQWLGGILSVPAKQAHSSVYCPVIWSFGKPRSRSIGTICVKWPLYSRLRKGM